MEKDRKDGSNKDKEGSHPHFIKAIKYNRESWLTDFLFGQRGFESHGHATLSGASLWYLRDEQGKEIIRNGSVVSNQTP